MTMIVTFKKNILHNLIRPGWRNSTRGRDRVGWWNLFWARNACTKSACCTIVACGLHEGWKSSSLWTNQSSIFINKSWLPWTAGQEKEISTRLRVFLWRTSSSTRTTKWAVDKAINHSTHIHPPFSRSWRTMQKVDLLKAWLEMICCRGFFSRIFPWWWFWYLERAWHFFSTFF